MRVDGLILAAGSGERFGGALPKAFAELAGIPLFVRAAQTAAAAGIGRLVIVVGRPDLVGEARRLLPAIGPAEVVIALGGATRVDSVRQGLGALDGSAEDIVVIHDAARPLATVGSFERVIAAVAAGAAGATAVLPATDTMATVVGGLIAAVPARSTMVRVQTPQAFRRQVVQLAHAQAAAAEDTEPTDDAGLVRRYAPSAVVAAVPGDERNLKITTPADLTLAARLLADA